MIYGLFLSAAPLTKSPTVALLFAVFVVSVVVAAWWYFWSIGKPHLYFVFAVVALIALKVLGII
jgi:hypothetical protein